MSNSVATGPPCPACGAPMAPGRSVCPSCGYVSRWFKVRLVVGCLFLLLAMAGLVGMIIMALYVPR